MSKCVLAKSTCFDAMMLDFVDKKKTSVEIYASCYTKLVKIRHMTISWGMVIIIHHPMTKSCWNPIRLEMIFEMIFATLIDIPSVPWSSWSMDQMLKWSMVLLHDIFVLLLVMLDHVFCPTQVPDFCAKKQSRVPLWDQPKSPPQRWICNAIVLTT